MEHDYNDWDASIDTFMLAFAFVLWAVICGAFLPACGATAREQHEVLNTITDVADPTYQAAVDGCDAFRNAIGVRTGTTYEEDEAAMNEVDRVCDTIVVGFEALRGTQLTARAAIDSGVVGAAAEGIAAGLGAWMELQELVPQLQSLGRSSGNEDEDPSAVPIEDEGGE